MEARTSSGVAEVQGLYGAFSFPEKLLQKIWLRGDFDRAGLVTSEGERVQVLQPGKWNLLGGPDFGGARLRFAGRARPDVQGDVELHLKAQDWEAHGHARDPAYDHVVLHVVLFAPPPGWVTRGRDGNSIPIVALLPLLHRSLEEFAADEAVEVLANRPLAKLPDELGRLSPEELARLLHENALARWRQKTRFAAGRIEKLGWTEACHQTALEILGYRFNRAPMVRIATAFPLSRWTTQPVGHVRLYESERDARGWSLQGVRPANHPLRRLAQYERWVVAHADWPARWRELANAVPHGTFDESTRESRRRLRFLEWRERLAREVCGDALSGTRLDTLITNGLLPLCGALGQEVAAPLWFHWFPGDLPGWLGAGLRQLGYLDGRSRPASQGVAQGLLGWLLAREPRS